MPMPEQVISEHPFAIIADEDLGSGFKALGFKVYPVRNTQEQARFLADAVNEKVAVCLVQEDIYHAQEDFINSHRNQALPVFIPFSKDLKHGLLESIIRQARLKATGKL